ncbi:MAG: hypothetical protein C4617_04520 [Candidatus Liberibacter europaeus]|uniref:Uncharacterized protein n=1 Tax=Candidatus Liberibacter europaeus TaxID=744859 RepID=A0A2T4VWW7_9HYPH|nr:hypothetical protein [Candidatus Liberibacter europaeus]PTL86273.1 MAG: hypothetical protein C4617_04520 [Candidatus Liberibacter europaeus]
MHVLDVAIMCVIGSLFSDRKDTLRCLAKWQEWKVDFSIFKGIWGMEKQKPDYIFMSEGFKETIKER